VLLEDLKGLVQLLWGAEPRPALFPDLAGLHPVVNVPGYDVVKEVLGALEVDQLERAVHPQGVGFQVGAPCRWYSLFSGACNVIVLCYIAQQMSDQLQHLKQAFKDLRQALEAAESALIEFEETLGGEEGAPDRPQGQISMELLSIPEVCQELGMGKSWVYRRLKSGEIPSIKLGHNIKVKRQDLNQYLESQHSEPSGE